MDRIKVVGMASLCFLCGCGGGDDAKSLFAEGAQYAAAGKYDEAIEVYQNGLEITPDDAAGINLLGMAYRWKYNTTGDLIWKEMEIESFQKAMMADSTYWPAIINLGASYYYLDRKKEAAPLFRKALEINPLNPEREELLKFISQGEAAQ